MPERVVGGNNAIMNRYAEGLGVFKHPIGDYSYTNAASTINTTKGPSIVSSRQDKRSSSINTRQNVTLKATSDGIIHEVSDIKQG